ncbi:MAG: zinc ribbon domain-containing protein [Candidatus Caldarchaeum sp.]
MKCGRCGAGLPRDAVYCYSCGKRVRSRLRPWVAFFAAVFVAAVVFAVVYPASPAYVFRGSEAAEVLRAAGYPVKVAGEGYAVLAVNGWSAVDFAELEKVLRSVDARWVILENSVDSGDLERAAQVASAMEGVNGVAGVYRGGVLVMVTVDNVSAQLLHTLFRMAGNDVRLVVRFT